MTVDQGFELHPGAASDITSIWEFISLRTALLQPGVSARVSWARFAGSSHFPTKATNERISLRGLSVSRLYAITLLPMHQTKSPSWQLLCSTVAAAPA